MVWFLGLALGRVTDIPGSVSYCTYLAILYLMLFVVMPSWIYIRPLVLSRLHTLGTPTKLMNVTLKIMPAPYPASNILSAMLRSITKTYKVSIISLVPG